jgi:hypothetical protein
VTEEAALGESAPSIAAGGGVGVLAVAGKVGVGGEWTTGAGVPASQAASASPAMTTTRARTLEV